MSGERNTNLDNIDVVIVMDCTGSMQRWINAAKDTVLEAFSEIKKQYTESTIRLGLVCYRDIGDDERFVISPLTENIESIQEVLKNVRATGGNDEAEDVAGALEKTIDLFKSSREGDNPLRIVLLVTDAPAHGLRYHTITVGDRFPNGDPDGREPYDQVRELVLMGTDLTIFRIKNTVNTMAEEFQKAFLGSQSTLTVLDIGKQDDSIRDEYSSSSSSFLLSSPYLLSGFIDISSYDDESFEKCEPKTPPPSSSSSSEFRLATCKSITSSIERRKV